MLAGVCLIGHAANGQRFFGGMSMTIEWYSLEMPTLSYSSTDNWTQKEVSIGGSDGALFSNPVWSMQIGLQIGQIECTSGLGYFSSDIWVPYHYTSEFVLPGVDPIDLDQSLHFTVSGAYWFGSVGFRLMHRVRTPVFKAGLRRNWYRYEESEAGRSLWLDVSGQPGMKDVLYDGDPDWSMELSAGYQLASNGLSSTRLYFTVEKRLDGLNKPVMADMDIYKVEFAFYLSHRKGGYIDFRDEL